MYFHPIQPVYCSQVKKEIEYTWWQDREMMTLSFWRRGLLWRHYLVLHPKTGAQIGYVRWWYGQNDIMDEEFEREVA